MTKPRSIILGGVVRVNETDDKTLARLNEEWHCYHAHVKAQEIKPLALLRHTNTDKFILYNVVVGDDPNKWVFHKTNEWNSVGMCVLELAPIVGVTRIEISHLLKKTYSD